MNQQTIRNFLSTYLDVIIQISQEDDGSPAIAHGNTFIFHKNAKGEAEKMSFVTIVEKDYPNFDEASNLNRENTFRLNINVGKQKFFELLGFNPTDFTDHTNAYDFSQIDTLFPHPVYGANGWVSIINPTENNTSLIKTLLDYSYQKSKS